VAKGPTLHSAEAVANMHGAQLCGDLHSTAHTAWQCTAEQLRGDRLRVGEAAACGISALLQGGHCALRQCVARRALPHRPGAPRECVALVQVARQLDRAEDHRVARR
jgi:hypothetical protein